MPAGEISFMYGIVTAGNQLSMVILMPLSTYVCEQRHLYGGWPLMYYATGVVTIVWLCLFWFTVSDYPEQHRFISTKELDYITSHCKKKPEVKVCKNVKTTKYLPPRSFYVYISDLPRTRPVLSRIAGTILKNV